MKVCKALHDNENGGNKECKSAKRESAILNEEGLVPGHLDCVVASVVPCFVHHGSCYVGRFVAAVHHRECVLPCGGRHLQPVPLGSAGQRPLRRSQTAAAGSSLNDACYGTAGRKGDGACNAVG